MFRNLQLLHYYSSVNNDVANEFYNPILKEAKRYDRSSAYFSAKALAYYSKGLEYFCKRGSKFRLIISKEIDEEDFRIIKKGYSIKADLKNNLLEKLNEKLSLEEEKNISNLAYLISRDIVDIKIAFMTEGIFHEKCGLFYDDDDNIICYRGSNNETLAALDKNFESFNVSCSWLDSKGFYMKGINQSIADFEKLWSNQFDNIHVVGADEVIMKEILKYNKNEIIVEEVLLKENCIILDYNNQLILRINMNDDFWITKSGFYKLKLKRYVDGINNKCIFFKKDLKYTDYIKIWNVIKKKADSIGRLCFKTHRLDDYIETRNLYIDKRATLGLDIKRQDDKIKPKFDRYSEIVNKQMTRKLRNKQMWDSFFMCAMTKSSNFSVPGSGKTSSVLGVYAYLNYKGLINKIVMIGPKNSFGSWIDEFNICFQGKHILKLFNIHNPKYKTSRDKKKGLRFDTHKANLILVNYECIGTYEEELKSIVDNKTLLVFDEVHRIKKVNGQTPGIYAGHALNICDRAIYKIAMTGTPIPNSYLDLYNLFHLLYKDEYDMFFGFKANMLKNVTKDDRDLINSKLKPFFCRTTKDNLNIPKANEDMLIKFCATKKEKKLFKILMNKYSKNKLTLFIRVLQLESNPKMLLNAIDKADFQYVLNNSNDIDEIDYIDYSDDIIKLINSVGITSKMTMCINKACELVEKDKKIIIWCIFKNSINEISNLLNDLGIKTKCIYGEIQLSERLTIIEDFKKGNIEVLITNPHTLAESVSLHTVCHDAIYFEYSFNLVHLLQSKDRIHRLGLPDNQYTQYYYLCMIFNNIDNLYSMDEQIYYRLCEKEKIMIEAINNDEFEEVTSVEEDLELILGNLF